jgi:hypothetical protein
MLASAYCNETEYSVWSDLSENFERGENTLFNIVKSVKLTFAVCLLWDEEPNAIQLREYFSTIFRPTYKRLGSEITF